MHMHVQFLYVKQKKDSSHQTNKYAILIIYV